MERLGKVQSKESKALCEAMAGQCQFAKPPRKAIESFNRKPYYFINEKEKMKIEGK